MARIRIRHVRGEGPPHVSIVVPVYNEEANLPLLFTRLYATLDGLACSWECVFVDDGSKDRSVAMLRAQYQLRPGPTRVIIFRRNFGQHAAIMAGFEAARGDVIITLDADLQNPPEEIPKLLAAADAGHGTMWGPSARVARTTGPYFSVAAHQFPARSHDAHSHHGPGLHACAPTPVT